MSMKRNIFTLILLFTLSITLNAQTLKDEWVICNTDGCKVLDPYFSNGVTMKWEGACVDGKANGFGKLTKYNNGQVESIYDGEFKNGSRDGEGKIIFKDKGVSVGTFKGGQLIGMGTWISDEGHKYQGEFVNYRHHGIGVLTYPNGSKSEGFFVSDYLYTGKFTNYDGKVIYIQKGNTVDKIVQKSSGYKPELSVKLTEYFDENWNRCKQKDAAYFRLVTYESENKPKGVIKDFFITGQLQSEFTAVYLDYDDEGKNFHEGEANWYFKNGKIEQKRFYYNNKINGKNTFYYDNGQIAQEANYIRGRLNGNYLQWYKTGKPKISAIYKDGVLLDNKFNEFDENGLGALVYQENFNFHKEIWESKGESHSSNINANNQLVFNLNETGTTLRTNYITLEQNSDYSIESVIQKKTGKGFDGYGIVFGFKDWQNYYQFLISENGYYLIKGQFEGINVTIKDWTKSDVINKLNQRNQLKIMKFGDEFIFSINSQIVQKTKSKDLRGNNIGIIAGGKGEYILENIIVKEFLSTQELEKKGPKNIANNSDDWLGNGSGFFINEKGYIATNYHVIKDANAIQVEYFQKGKKNTYLAKVIVTDKQNDLAIIQINDLKFKVLPSIPYTFSTNIRDVGTDVFALGYPMADIMGSEIKFTDGKISAKTGIMGDVTVYQVSVPIQPGNSGGPLFDSKGNLVGITSSALNKEYFNSENVNYAIKTSYLKNLIEVMPERINLPNNIEIYNHPLTEKIKLLSDFIPIIKVK